MRRGNPLRRVALTVAGTLMVLGGTALLVLPGPGLLLVLAGLVTLAAEFPALQRFVGPVRARAMKAAEDSVANPLRITGSVLAGSGLIAAGVVWGVVSWVPFAGWATGASLILSGFLLLGLLYYSYRRVQQRVPQD